MKTNFIALFILVIVHIVYDWAIPFVHDNGKALFYSLWNLSTYGYICYRLIYDSFNSQLKLHRNILTTLSIFFGYRSILNTAALIRSIRFDDNSYNAYKDITSNYTGDVLIWSIILISLLIITRTHIYDIIKKKCRKTKIT